MALDREKADLPSRLLDILPIIVIIAAAAFLRFDLLNLAEFKGDEAATSFVVRSLVQRGVVPLTGPGLTTGGHDGPFYYYLLALPFAISANPLAATAFVAALNLLGIVLTYRLADEFFNRRVAVMATALLAVSPFAVLFSRKIWNPDLVFPFAVVVLYCLYSFAVKKKPAYFIPLLVAYSMLVQIHSVTLFLAPALLYFAVKLRRQLPLKHLAAAVLLSAADMSPMVYGQLAGGLSEAGALASAVRYFGAPDPRTVAGLSSITGGTGFGYVLGGDAGQFYASIFGLDRLFVLEGALLFLALGFVLWKAAKERGSPTYSILFAWVAVPALTLLFFDPRYLLPHEFTMFMPANFLAIGVLLDESMSLDRRTAHPGFLAGSAKVAAVAVLAIILVSQVVFAAGFIGLLGAQGGTSGDYGVGVQYKMDAASYIAQSSGGRNFTISTDLVPGDIGNEYTYLLSLYGAAPSGSAALHYVVVDGISPVDPTLAAELAGDQRSNFGPLEVYSYTT